MEAHVRHAQTFLYMYYDIRVSHKHWVLGVNALAKRNEHTQSRADCKVHMTIPLLRLPPLPPAPSRCMYFSLASGQDVKTAAEAYQAYPSAGALQPAPESSDVAIVRGGGYEGRIDCGCSGGRGGPRHQVPGVLRQ